MLVTQLIQCYQQCLSTAKNSCRDAMFVGNGACYSKRFKGQTHMLKILMKFLAQMLGAVLSYCDVSLNLEMFIFPEEVQIWNAIAKLRGAAVTHPEFKRRVHFFLHFPPRFFLPQITCRVRFEKSQNPFAKHFW